MTARTGRGLVATIAEGSKFGSLTFTGATYRDRRHWVLGCQCDCGQAAKVRVDRWGKNRSCKSCAPAVRATSNTKHGYSNTLTYNTWISMIDRCTNPKATGWENYGGRGIAVCPQWFDLETFIGDMGHRPPGTTIDRIDGNGGYHPGNCRWATPTQQSQNRRLPKAVGMCRKGLHALADESTYFNRTTGTRTCKQCAKDRAAAQYRRKQLYASVPQLDAPANP